MFRAVKTEDMSLHDISMRDLGRGLHTLKINILILPKISKATLDHFFSGKDPDNPNKHRDEWDDACRDNIQLIKRLQRRTNSEATANNNDERFER